MNTTTEALQAAEWVVNMDNGPERSRLYNGHISRRIETWDRQSYPVTDHTQADAWLIAEWRAATD